LAKTVFECVKKQDWDGIPELAPELLVDYDNVVLFSRDSGMILPQRGA